jgi:hypothetical protein
MRMILRISLWRRHAARVSGLTASQAYSLFNRPTLILLVQRPVHLLEQTNIHI